MTPARATVPPPGGPLPALVGTALLGLPVGSIYAWSLFYKPIEAELGIGRSWLSGSFALGSALFALSMVAAPWIARGWPGWRLAIVAGLCNGIGVALPGLVRDVWAIVLGYGGLFAVGCGLSYSLALQSCMAALPNRLGLAAGFTALSGALGSILGALIYGWSMEALGPWQSLIWSGGLFFLFGLAAAAMLRRIVMPLVVRNRGPATAESARERRLELRLWLGFFLGAAAGLMALGHAAGIAGAYGATVAVAGIATALITAGNGTGRIGAGYLADKVPVRRILATAPLLAAALLAALAAFPSLPLAVTTLGAVGLAYGSIAACYPAAVAFYFGRARVGVIYGRVFTAWGVAGLISPGIAGYLYDLTGGYRLALIGAALCALASAGVAATLPRPVAAPNATA